MRGDIWIKAHLSLFQAHIASIMEAIFMCLAFTQRMNARSHMCERLNDI